MRLKNYILIFISICLVLVTIACDSESDKRKARIQELEQKAEETQEKINLLNDYLNACEKVDKC